MQLRTKPWRRGVCLYRGEAQGEVALRHVGGNMARRVIEIGDIDVRGLAGAYAVNRELARRNVSPYWHFAVARIVFAHRVLNGEK